MSDLKKLNFCAEWYIDCIDWLWYHDLVDCVDKVDWGICCLFISQNKMNKVDQGLRDYSLISLLATEINVVCSDSIYDED